MRYLLVGLLILMAGAVLFAAGSERVARAPEEWSPNDANPSGYIGDVAEVVVTAERPAGLMPEVVVRANLMSEVVAHASRPRSLAAR